jgi:hypothetical protein
MIASRRRRHVDRVEKASHRGEKGKKKIKRYKCHWNGPGAAPTFPETSSKYISAIVFTSQAHSTGQSYLLAARGAGEPRVGP